MMIERTIATLVKHAKEYTGEWNAGSPVHNFNMGLANATANIIADIGLVEWNGNTQDTLRRFLDTYDNECDTRPLPNTNGLVREAFAQ